MKSRNVKRRMTIIESSGEVRFSTTANNSKKRSKSIVSTLRLKRLKSRSNSLACYDIKVVASTIIKPLKFKRHEMVLVLSLLAGNHYLCCVSDSVCD